MITLPTNTPSVIPFPVEPQVEPETDFGPSADLLEQIEAAQNETADALDALTQTTAQAIENALSVAGIKAPALLAEGAKALKAQLPLLLHLGAEMFLIQREEVGLPFYDALRDAIDAREASTRYWNAHREAGDMVGAFQEWIEEERGRLLSQIDLLMDELSNKAPLAKTARKQGFGEEMIAHYNARCAALFEAREALALLEANADLTRFEVAELPNCSAKTLLLWERFCGEWFD